MSLGPNGLLTQPNLTNRTHWLGSLQTEQYLEVLRQDVHCYFTIPFILSWSLLEAMAVGWGIVSSSTPPVLEVLEDVSLRF